MDIKVGDYIRDKSGKIGIFNGYNIRKESQWKYKIRYGNRKNDLYCTEEFIVKHSPNIIDLIERDDYVNGHRVIKNLKDSKQYYNSRHDYITCVDYTFEEDEIKNVVTKEQFKNVMYEV